MMDASGPQTPLRDLETPTFAQQDIFGGNPRVLKDDFAVPMRRVVEAENGKHTADRDALRVGRHEYHGLLPIPVGAVRIGLAHDDEQLAARVAGAGRPPLASIDDIFSAVAKIGAADVGRV